MQHVAKSIRAFIGAKDFEESRAFYKELGFTESVIDKGFSYFTVCDSLGFYLQNYYAKDWIENSMLFLEVDDATKYFERLQKLELDKKFKGVKLTPVKEYDWGKECFLHDPAGVLWHFGNFFKNDKS